MVDRAGIEAMLHEDAAAVRAPFQAAMAGGGRDTVSIVTVRIISGGS